MANNKKRKINSSKIDFRIEIEALIKFTSNGKWIGT